MSPRDGGSPFAITAVRITAANSHPQTHNASPDPTPSRLLHSNGGPRYLARATFAVTVAVLRLRFALPSETLKEKRSIVKSVVERVRSRYNASCAEIADLDSPSYTTIGIACIANESQHADRQVQSIAAAVESWRLDAELLDVEIELIQV